MTLLNPVKKKKSEVSSISLHNINATRLSQKDVLASNSTNIFCSFYCSCAACTHMHVHSSSVVCINSSAAFPSLPVLY